MSLDNLLDPRECPHSILREDGEWELMQSTLYTCRHPNPEVPQCHGSFTSHSRNMDDYEPLMWFKGHQYYMLKEFNNDDETP